MAFTKEDLERSRDMKPVSGSVEIDLPVDVLWNCFTNARLWPRWNRCMFWALNHDLRRDQRLVWAFQPLRWWYLYRLPGIARLVEVEKHHKVTWEVRALPGFYARHTYLMDDLDGGRSRFGSWEQAMGPTFRLLRKFWLAHFEFVKNRSLQGARLLAQVYRRQGILDHSTLKRPLLMTPLKETLRSVGLLRLQYREITSGVYAVLGGGGNSLVIQDGNDVLLVDTKLPPFSRILRNWIEGKLAARVTKIVNTHFHYDHTHGNGLYPSAQILAHRTAPDLMRRRDAAWWQKHPEGLPIETNLVDEASTVEVGEQQVSLHHSGRGHTASDLWIRLERNGVEIIATGDVASLGIYPYFDLGEGGVDIKRMIWQLREWAQTHSEAIFVPGHGPVASAADLLEHADYLEFLTKSVVGARESGMTLNETLRNIDLSLFDLSIVPMFREGTIALNARTNITSLYQLQQGGP